MDIFDSLPANLARVEDEVSDCTSFGVGGICLHPTIAWRKTSSNCAIGECLNSFSWGCKLIWREYLAVRISNIRKMGWTCSSSHSKVQPGMAASSRTYLLVETANKAGCHWIQRSEQIQMVRCQGCENDFHSDIWSQTSVIFLGVRNKRWAKAIWRHHRCASLYKFFRVSAVKKVLYQHTGRNDKRWLGLCCCKLDILAHDVIITLCQQQRVFWSIKWLLNW